MTDEESRAKSLNPPKGFYGLKRTLLLAALVTQVLSYYLLTEARYRGQGLEPRFFSIANSSDVAALAIASIIFGLILHAIIRIHWLSLLRTLFAVLFSLLLLWIDFGVLKFDATEFSPTASITILLGTSLLIATLITPSLPFLKPGKRAWRVVLNGLLVLTALNLISFVYSFTYPTYSEIREISDFEADAGVVLGAAVWRGNRLGNRPSPTFRERIEVGYELLARDAIPRLVVTGASAPGEIAEADVAKKEFIKKGVDESRLIAESRSRSTLEQVVYLRDDLHKKQGWQRFVIISDQYHLARVVEICRFNGLDAIGTPSRIRQPFFDLAYYRVRESLALLSYWLLGK